MQGFTVSYTVQLFILSIDSKYFVSFRKGSQDVPSLAWFLVQLDFQKVVVHQ